MQEADDFRPVVGNDVLGEAPKGIAAGAACIHHGGHPGPHAANVGGHAVGVDPVIDVGVNVD